MTTDLEFQPLSSDFVPWIADPATQAVLVTVIHVDLKPLPGQEPATLAGTVRVRVDEVISSARLNIGDLIDLLAQQVTDPMVRVRNAADHWNVLQLVAGKRWMVMCRIGDDKGRWLALAADELTAGGSDPLQPLRTAYEIERGVRARRADAEAFVRALGAPSDLLHRYALDAVAGRKVFGRDQGAALLERVLRSRTVVGVRAVEALTFALRMGLFAGSFGADATNLKMLGLMAGGLVAEQDPALAQRWARLLTAAGLGELSEDPRRDGELRRQLLSGVKSPAAAEVLSALARQAQRSDDVGRALLQRLIDAWKAAA